MKVLLTCGAGDFIAIESFLTHKETQSVDTIYWATRARETILPLIPFAFPNVKNHIIVKDDWSDAFTEGFSIESGKDLDLPTDVVDWNITKIRDEARRGSRQFRGSAFVKQQLAQVSDLNLPESYFVVHPFSINARTLDRDITAEEWTMICRSSRVCGIPVVVVNQGDETLKRYPGVIDLTNKLSLLQALEVVKQSRGFIGASSIFSVMASKVLSQSQLFIKGHDLLKNDFAWFYYAPIEPANRSVFKNLSKPIRAIERYSKKREIIVNTVQGIGDIFWVYQKLAPYFDKLHLNILCTALNNNVQQRGMQFAKMLPKVESVTMSKVSSETYTRVASTHVSIEEVLRTYDAFLDGELQSPNHDPELSALTIANEHTTINYAVNAPLEIGTRIEAIDHGTMLEEFVDLGLPKVVPKEDYLCLFVAGAKNDKLWTPKTWVKLVDGMMTKLNLSNVVLIGAEWDVPVQSEIEQLLETKYTVVNYVAEFDLRDSIDVIRRSKFFIGYQSGLSILADNYDVQQLMIYFEQLRPMMYSWCKQKNLGTTFQAACFDDSVEAILENLKL